MQDNGAHINNKKERPLKTYSLHKTFENVLVNSYLSNLTLV